MDSRTTVLGIARVASSWDWQCSCSPAWCCAFCSAGTRRRRRPAFWRGCSARGEVVLGVGTVTSVKERTQDAEWVSVCAVADAVDGLAMAFSPGVPRRSRPGAIVGATAAVLGMQAARQLADERKAALSSGACRRPDRGPLTRGSRPATALQKSIPDSSGIHCRAPVDRGAPPVPVEHSRRLDGLGAAPRSWRARRPNRDGRPRRPPVTRRRARSPRGPERSRPAAAWRRRAPARTWGCRLIPPSTRRVSTLS